MESEEPAPEPTEEVCTRVLRTKHKRKCKAEPKEQPPVEKAPRPERRERSRISRPRRVPAKVKTSSGEEITHWLIRSDPETRLHRPDYGIKVFDQTKPTFSIEDLRACPDQTACWDGVRNYLSRNFMMKGMKLGHKVFFYHSDVNNPGIAGICEDTSISISIFLQEENEKVVRESYVDHTQFDPTNPRYDAVYCHATSVQQPSMGKHKTAVVGRNSTIDNPRWFMVDIKFDRMMKRYIPLSELKTHHDIHRDNGGPLRSLSLFTKNILCVQPVTEEEWNFITSLEDQ